MRALYGNEILELIGHDIALERRFLGVYAANELPKRIPNGKMLITNCCPRKLPGMHWLAMFQRGNALEFFDSFGQTPSLYADLSLPEYSKLVANSHQLQSELSEVMCLLRHILLLLQVEKLDV